ncbi:uncharacterized protein METZ01_LOCUS125178 [marine metagenome]|uniref:Uncharacterized protein n=1 Tax=marine metagenome TaxID=408172 RepID=A0A381Y5N2_9ZZZZ
MAAIAARSPCVSHSSSQSLTVEYTLGWMMDSRSFRAAESANTFLPSAARSIWPSSFKMFVPKRATI